MRGRAVPPSARARQAAAKEDPLTAEYTNRGLSVCRAVTARVISRSRPRSWPRASTKGELNG